MKERKISYNFFKVIYTVLSKVLFRPKAIAKDNIPKEGAIIFAGNHKHAADPVLVMSNTKRFVHFMAKEEVSGGLHGKIFDLIGVIRVYKDKTKNVASIAKAKEVLNNGSCLGIFPEGTRNRTKDELLRFKLGTVRIAKDTNTKIIPFAIRGKYRLFRKGLEIEFGKPIDISNMKLDEANEYLKSSVLELLRK